MVLHASGHDIHGRARQVDDRMCFAMYHPAGGLHQQSLKDTIRADFKKISTVVAEAERLAAEGKLKAATKVCAVVSQTCPMPRSLLAASSLPSGDQASAYTSPKR